MFWAYATPIDQAEISALQKLSFLQALPSSAYLAVTMVSLFNSRKKEQERQEKQHLFDKVVEAERIKQQQDEAHKRELDEQRQQTKRLEAMMARQRADNKIKDEIVARRFQEAEERAAVIQREAELERAKRADQKRIEMQRKMDDDRQKAIRDSKLATGSPETLRDLRELIRDKFELDVRIWGLRGARKPNRPIVEKKMEKSDGVMEEILYMVGLWGDNSDNRWSDEEWERVELIRQKLHEGGHIKWATSQKPWEMSNGR